MNPTHVIIVAAGTGTRFGSDLPKQFADLCGKPVLAHAIETFRKALPASGMTVVISAAMRDSWSELCRTHGIAPHHVVNGGSTRWESVKNAINSLNGMPAGTTVLIHDGARPLVDEKTIMAAAAAARNTDGAIPATPVTDSLRQLDDNETASEAVDRSRFRAVQTPQAFVLWRLREAYGLPYQPEFTDDASVLAAAGFSNIVLTPGSPSNLKITTPVDLIIAKAIIEARSHREQ